MEKKLKLLDVEKAEKIILRKVKPLKGKEKIDIKDSFGRVLISNLNSKRNQPISKRWCYLHQGEI